MRFTFRNLHHYCVFLDSAPGTSELRDGRRGRSLSISLAPSPASQIDLRVALDGMDVVKDDAARCGWLPKDWAIGLKMTESALLALPSDSVFDREIKWSASASAGDAHSHVGMDGYWRSAIVYWRRKVDRYVGFRARQ